MSRIAERDRAVARLGIAKIRLSRMGPPSEDLTVASSRRRDELIERIAILEAELGTQMSLGLEPEEPAATLDEAYERLRS